MSGGLSQTPPGAKLYQLRNSRQRLEPFWTRLPGNSATFACCPVESTYTLSRGGSLFLESILAVIDEAVRSGIGPVQMASGEFEVQWAPSYSA
jgi:hypothetical protein